MTSDSTVAKPGSIQRILRPILYLALGALIAFGTVRAWQIMEETASDPAFEKHIVQRYGLGEGGQPSLPPARPLAAPAPPGAPSSPPALPPA